MEVLIQILHFLCLLSVIVCLQLKPSLNINTPLDILLNNVNANNNKLDESNFRKQCFCIPKTSNSQSVRNLLAPNNDNLERLVLYLYKNNGVVQVYIPNRYKQELIPELNFDKHQGDILKPASTETVLNIFDNSLNFITSPKRTVKIVEEIISDSETTSFVSNKPLGYNTNDNKQSNNDNVYISPIAPGVNTGIKGNKPFDEQNVSINIAIKPSRQTPGETINIPGLTPNDVDLLQIPPISTSGSQGATQNAIKNPITGQVLVNGQVIPNLVNVNQLGSNSKINNAYPTFYDWFDNQLARVVLYNVETQTKLLELRQRIKVILQNNGMYVGLNGIVRDSNGYLVRMSNIKFRPILIGNQVDARSLVYQRTQTVVPYVQIIEIIQTTPPRLLGTLVLGTVYLPRNVNLQKIHSLNRHRFAYVIQNGRRQYGGCTTCKYPQYTRRYSYPNSADNDNYASVTGTFGEAEPSYTARRNFDTDEQNLTEKSTLDEGIEEPAPEESRQEDSDDVGRSGSVGGVVDGLLGNLGMTPTLIAEPSRRLLGGVIPSSPAPGPRGYPNDVLPGFRIIGGNAATSSGTPLVSKGRSGSEKPSLII